MVARYLCGSRSSHEPCPPSYVLGLRWMLRVVSRFEVSKPRKRVTWDKVGGVTVRENIWSAVITLAE